MAKNYTNIFKKDIIFYFLTLKELQKKLEYLILYPNFKFCRADTNSRGFEPATLVAGPVLSYTRCVKVWPGEPVSNLTNVFSKIT